MTTFLLVHGPKDSGKTTVALSIAGCFWHKKILFIDTDPTNPLFSQFTQEQPPLSLGNLALKIAEKAYTSVEQLDWAFSELAVPVSETQDVFALGVHNDWDFQPFIIEKLQTGFHRFCKDYDYCVIDGSHPLMALLCHPQDVICLEILTEAALESWQGTVFSDPKIPDNTESQQGLFFSAAIIQYAILVNKVHSDTKSSLAYSKVLNSAILHSQTKLIGKIPFFNSSLTFNNEFEIALEPCLQRLNLQF
ncbi:MAG: hypothetical protein AAGI66_02940 [Cyanobacteria bacterium P01_H01_bin.74]